MRVDLNADVGESFGAYAIGCDDGLMRSVTSASVAAGFHGGDPSVLRDTIRKAKAAGVAVGAHPGFPDLAGFGRRDMHLAAREVEDLVLYQVAAVAGMAAAEGVRLQHVKPHGALYNQAVRDRAVALAVARAVSAFDASLRVFCPAGSALAAAATDEGLTVVPEAFADRAYLADGSLVSRQLGGAVLDDPDAVVPRAIRMVKNGEVLALAGGVVTLQVATLCVHGDTRGADVLAARVRSALEAAGVLVRAPAAP